MSDELKRIEIQTVADPAKLPEKPVSMKRKNGSIALVFGILAGAAVVGLLVYVFLVMPMRRVYGKAQLLLASGRELSQAIKSQNLDAAKTSLAKTRTDLSAVKAEYVPISRMKFIPLLGAYISDGDHALKAADAGLDAVDNAIQALEPNADLLGLKGTSSFVSGSADERIQTAVKTMKALTPKINDMAVNIKSLQTELDAIDPNRYPVRFGKTEIRPRMIAAKDTIDSAANLFVNAQPLLVQLPSILGEPVEKRYLVLFQNDAELRPTGGFISAYAQFRVVGGKLILEKSDDIYTLDAALTQKFPAPPEILKFHKGVFQFNIRDSNLSPDFRESMLQFMKMYDTVRGKEKIDGIIAVDTHVLVEALRILGPMTIDGRPMTVDIDKRCNCPRVIYELEDESTRPVGYIRSDRKAILGTLLQRIMQQALGVSPSQYWGQLFQMIITEINQKHVLAYFTDSEMQKAAESFNMAGRIMNSEDSTKLLKYQDGNGWDYLHVNNANMAGAKSNLFTNEEMTKDVKINSDGTITTTLSVKYSNTFPHSDCNLERGGLCLNAPLRNWVRVYVPKGSKLVESKGLISPQTGKSVPMDTYDSLGKTVFEGFLIVNPQSSTTFELTYTSPVKSPDGKYRLLWQKQPGTDGQQITVKLNGRERSKFLLSTDTELTL